jgi:hypothetical protein
MTWKTILTAAVIGGAVSAVFGPYGACAMTGAVTALMLMS